MTPSGRRIHDPPGLPPPDFDPVNNSADRARLEEFWLPSRPDPEREPELHEHWREMFAGRLRFVLAGSQPAKQPVTTALLAMRLPGPPATAGFETSSNWSGAYILPNRGDRFSRVVGGWKAPEVKPGTGPNPSGLPFRCSIWIGLDGKKRWTGSMPQVGTVHAVAPDGTPEEPKLWWQWWIRDGHSAPHDIPGVPVRAGDEVLCSLTAVSPHLVRFHVRNRNTGTFAGFAVSEPVPLRGATAEWVVEQPSDPQGDPRAVKGRREGEPLFPLPDYGSVAFRHCAAQAGAAPGFGNRYHPLRTPRLIRMSQLLTQPTRKALISVPSRRGQQPGELRVSYRAP